MLEKSTINSIYCYMYTIMHLDQRLIAQILSFKEGIATIIRLRMTLYLFMEDAHRKLVISIMKYNGYIRDGHLFSYFSA